MLIFQFSTKVEQIWFLKSLRYQNVSADENNAIVLFLALTFLFLLSHHHLKKFNFFPCLVSVCLLAKVLPSYTLLAAALLIFIQVTKFFSVSLAISGLLDRLHCNESSIECHYCEPLLPGGPFLGRIKK
jgi:hypothetical protein